LQRLSFRIVEPEIGEDVLGSLLDAKHSVLSNAA